MTNAEKYKTAKERAEAFAAYAKPLAPRNEYEFGVCAFEWLDLEAKEEEPLPCPFCGVPVSYDDKKECIECFCGYRSTSVSSKNVTIEAHNRICRAAAKGRESTK